MHLQLLGPVEVAVDGRTVPLGATKQRAVLAMLALEANAAVPLDRLVEGLWGEEPPATAAKMVQLYVSQLRRVLAADDAEIVTHGRAYELRVDDEAVDAVRFERLVERAGSDPTAAGEALSLWHGAPLADVADEPFAAAEIRRLNELRLRAKELAIEGDLAAGRNQEALAQLEPLIEDHPLRERLHAQRMLALYRSGRQAEALEAYVAARRRLVDDVGVEPGAELRELHERILRQDRSLRLPSRRAETDQREGRPPAPSEAPPVARRLLLGAAAAVLIALAVFAITRMDGDGLAGIEEGAVGVIDPDEAAIAAQYRIGRESEAVVRGAGSVWVASPSDGTVSRIHAGGDRIDTIDAGPAPTGLAFGAGSLWVAGGEDGAVAQVDPVANRVVQRILVGNGLRAVAVAGGALWAALSLDGEIARIDLRSGRVSRRVAVGGHPVALATGAGAVWAVAEESGTVVRIDPRSGQVLESIAVGNGPSAVAVGLGAVWTANRQDGTVSRIDPATDRVTETVRAGRAPTALAIADGALWVADASGAVLRLDRSEGAVAETVRTGSSPTALAIVDGAIWVTAVAGAEAHRGGTLRVGTIPIELDPAVSGYIPDAVPVLELVYEGLLAHRRAAGAAGGRLVGGLALDVPEPADNGLRYVFRLRQGVRYSDGSFVRARDFRASMERTLALGGPDLPPLFNAIEGAEQCRTAPATCDLSRGIESDDRAGTITIRLRRPDPELLRKLTLPLAAVLPADTPRRNLGPRGPAGTGPYRVRLAVPGERALLSRNPHFRAQTPARRPPGFADRIAVKMGDESAHVAAAESADLDLAGVFATATSRRLAALRTRIRTRLQSGALAMTEYAWLNVDAAPFRDLRVRRALNLAVDRRRVVDLTGGVDAGSPTCQLLPPGLPGYRPVCTFTASPSPAGAWTAPEQAKARRLIGASGTRGTAVDVWTWPDRRSVGRYLAELLRDLGFPSRVRVFKDLGALLAAAADPRRRAQIGVNGWIADSPDPGGFLRALVSCDAYRPGEPGSTNSSRFCDRDVDAAIERAQTRGPEAGAAWKQLERRIAESAPLVPLVNRRSVAVTSPRAGNLQFHPLSGVLLDQVWVR